MSFAAWYGLRAYSTATRGTKSVQVCNVSDVVCSDLSTDGTTGDLVVTTIGGSNCAVVTCTVKTLYDKVGTNDLTQATIANRPVFTQNSLGTSWGMAFTAASSEQLVGPNLSPQAQQYYFYVVANWNGAANAGIWAADSGGFAGAIAEFETAGPNFAIFAGSTLTASATANAWHAVQSLFNGASSVISVDNTETTGAAGAQGAFNMVAAPLRLGNDISSFFSGSVMEIGYLAATVSSGNRTSLNSNAHAAYGGW